MSDIRVAVVPGDGIGVDVTTEAVRVLEAVTESAGRKARLTHFEWGAEHFLKTGVTLPEGAVQELTEGFDAILLGLRFRLDLYVNYRPVKLFHEKLCPLKAVAPKEVDFVVFRENTEGLYVMMGGNFKKGTPDEVAVQEEIHTRKGVARSIREGQTAVDLGGKLTTSQVGDLLARAIATPVAVGR